MLALVLSFVVLSLSQEIAWSTGPSPYDYSATIELCDPAGTTWSYGYRQFGGTCTSPGPIIRLTRGKSYRLVFRSAVSLGTQKSNIHFHGLHVSGDGSSEDINRVIDSTKNCLTYNLTVPSIHSGGTYWYHTHAHGSTPAQVKGGAYGMLIVADADSTGAFPEIPASITGTARTNIQTWMTSEIQIFCHKQSTTWYCNGVTNPSISLVQNQWHHIRLASSMPSGNVPQTLAFACVGTGCTNNCQVREMSRDGLWRPVVPKSAATSWTVGSANRLDLAIRCTNTNQHKFTFAGTAITNVNTVAGSPNTGTPFNGASGTWVPAIPPYMVDMRSTTPAQTHTLSLSSSSTTYDGVTKAYNALVANGNVPFDSVIQFTVSTSGTHPFHLHGVPFQVTGTCSGYVTGEFYDTISTSSACVIKFKTVTHGGRLPYHCHILVHGDAGTMGWMNITGGPCFCGTESVPAYVC